MEVVFGGAAKRWEQWRELLGEHFGLRDGHDAELQKLWQNISPEKFKDLFETREKLEHFFALLEQGGAVTDELSEESLQSRTVAQVMTAIARTQQIVPVEMDEEAWSRAA